MEMEIECSQIEGEEEEEEGEIFARFLELFFPGNSVREKSSYKVFMRKKAVAI